MEDISRFNEHRENTTVFLLESKRRQEMDIEEEQREVRKAAREAFAEEGGTYPVIRIDAEEQPELLADEPESEDSEDGEDGEAASDSDNQSDVLLKEDVRVVGDIITMMPTQRTSQLDPATGEKIN